MSVAVGMLFLVAGLAAVVVALPLTHRLARVMPQWVFSRGDVERAGVDDVSHRVRRASRRGDGRGVAAPQG